MGNKESKRETVDVNFIEQIASVHLEEDETSFSSQLEESPYQTRRKRVDEVLKDLRTIRQMYSKYFSVPMGSEPDLEEELLKSNPERARSILNLELRGMVFLVSSIDVLSDNIVKYLN